ncbi:MAG: hypothetical protein O2973_13630 [Gemmatimonadetes bacterium]|nr:hypothetical protein [Gemmatimonadota bacterium]
MRPYHIRALLAAGALSALAPSALFAQQAPTNDAPNPYRTIEGWGKMPAGRAWGSTSAVAVDKDGVSIWVAERCGQNDCVDSPLDPVLRFDKDGNLVKSFGAGMVRSPHGIHVDIDGNVWVADCSCTGAGGGGRGGRGAAGGAPTPPPPSLTSGHQVYKFSPEGHLLLTIGKAGGARDPDYLFQPNAVTTAPNGDIYIAEGHGSTAGSSPAAVLKFDRTGKLLARWGTVFDPTKSDEPYAFNQPHALAFDSKGRLFVADRGYDRLKIFDQSGKLLDTWYQFSRISGLYIDANDIIYAADSESETVSRNPDRTPSRIDWKRGIRIGSATDGRVTAFIPDPWPRCETGQRPTEAAPCSPSTSAAEGVAVDKNGVIYGAEVGPRALKRYVKR